jgi:DNA-binding response OmpR family regulator
MTHEKRRGIIVVEDEPIVLNMVQEILEEQGYEVIGAATPSELDHLMGDIDPQLVLVDMMLPEESGMQLAQRLRESYFPHTAMVAMSADRLTLLFASRSGLFQGTVAKPFEISTLLEVTAKNVGTYVTA